MKYPTVTLHGMLDQTASTSPDQTALIYFGCKISYRQLDEQVSRLAAGLQALGLGKGDRVALFMPNCPQFVIAYFGALRAGAIVTATSSMYTARELSHQWHDAGVTIAIVDRRLAKAVKAGLPEMPGLRHVILTGAREYTPRHFPKLSEFHASQKSAQREAKPGKPAFHRWEDIINISAAPKLVEVAQSEVACLQYTGGTTGKSKGAMLTHANLVINAWQFQHLIPGEKLLVVAALPLFHIYAMQCVMISSIMVGGGIVVLPRFELKAALNVIRKYRPTVFHGVPTMYVAFNSVPNIKKYGLNSLRFCTSGGAPLPVEVRQKFEALTGGKLVEGYGLTETSPVTHFNPPNGVIKTGSIGLPIKDTEARIMDLDEGTREMPVGEVGEIAIRGPQVMKGYWNKPDETALVLRDGWLYTGDIGRKDEDGYFYIVDRKKDMIIASGYNVYPREVEEVLFECPKVKEAGVIGVPDGYRGETVKAFVVLKDGQTATPEEIIQFCKERLATYKVPRMVVFRDSLPKSAVGKYLRRELRNL